jgi:hypothetical protein
LTEQEAADLQKFWQNYVKLIQFYRNPL